MLVKIGKRYSFDAAHQLKEHQGKCANVHGHTYTVEVWVKGAQLTNNESWRPFKSYPGYKTDETMVMDYFDLDAIVKPIIEQLDHSFLSANLSEPVFDLDTIDIDKALGNVVELPIARTTAEELSVWLWKRIATKLKDWKNIQLLGIVVSETPKTFAEYIGEVPYG